MTKKFNLSSFAKDRPRKGGKFVKADATIEPISPNAAEEPVKTGDCPDCPIDKKTGKPSGLTDFQTICPTCEGSGQV